MLSAALVLVVAAAAVGTEGSEDTHETHIPFLKCCPENFTDYDLNADFYKYAAEGHWPLVLVPDIEETHGWYSGFLDYVLTSTSGVYEREFNYSTCCTSESSLFNRGTIKADGPGVVTIYFSSGLTAKGYFLKYACGHYGYLLFCSEHGTSDVDFRMVVGRRPLDSCEWGEIFMYDYYHFSGHLNHLYPPC